MLKLSKASWRGKKKLQNDKERNASTVSTTGRVHLKRHLQHITDIAKLYPTETCESLKTRFFSGQHNMRTIPLSAPPRAWKVALHGSLEHIWNFHHLHILELATMSAWGQILPPAPREDSSLKSEKFEPPHKSPN